MNPDDEFERIMYEIRNSPKGSGMDPHALDKLYEILDAHYRNLWNRFGGRRRMVGKKWKTILESLDIETIASPDEPSKLWLEGPGTRKVPRVDEGFVLVRDPRPGEDWLKMDRDVALKILVMGMP
jgi:hypothetical protein